MEPEESYQYFVGVDVSKRTLDACLLDPTADKKRFSREVPNDEEGIASLIRWLDDHEAAPDSTVLCIENTGHYDDRLLDIVTVAGYPCAVENTTVLKKVRPEHHRKGDGFDAALLAEYAYRFEDKLRLWRADRPVIEEIRLLYRERRRLKTLRAGVSQLQQEAPYRTADTRFAEKLWKDQLTFFDAQIAHLEKKLQELVRSDEDVFRCYQRIRSIPGFGAVASMLWTMSFFGQERLNPRQIASRFGFAPHERQSGTSQRRRGRSTGHGKAEMRKVLTLSARSAGHHDEKLNRYKERKLAEGKPSKLVTNNMRNKLIRIACSIWNQRTDYDPSYVSPCTPKAAITT